MNVAKITSKFKRIFLVKQTRLAHFVYYVLAIVLIKQIKTLECRIPNTTCPHHHVIYGGVCSLITAKMRLNNSIRLIDFQAVQCN